MNKEPRRAAFTVLVVEDDDDHAVLLQRTFATVAPEIQVVRVADGLQALDFLRNQAPHEDAPTPDLVLLDLKLPRLDGHGVLEQIKTDSELMSIPVVVLTTSAAAVDRARAYRHHANSYLLKPVNPRVFRDMLRDVGVYWSEWNQRPFGYAQ